jgi:hypothetical protein
MDVINCVLIESSEGFIYADAVTGKVERVDTSHSDCYFIGAERINLSENEHFWNRKLMPGDCLDILDIGVWLNNGEYIEPEMNWRNDTLTELTED